jgi:hypothetical protein
LKSCWRVTSTADATRPSTKTVKPTSLNLVIVNTYSTQAGAAPESPLTVRVV